MRGAERPAKVKWTHPFLPPLQPLSDEAAKQTFMDITDNSHAMEDIHQLLQFTDNMPLAVDLMAHLSNYEGLASLHTRWATEKTSLLAVGRGRNSNLDASIGLSLSSPRVTPDSKQLLSILSILPNGLSDIELVQSNLAIPNILSCRATLLATSLAYRDGSKRLRSLIPVREHIQQFLPPSQLLIQDLRKHFYGLLKLYEKYHGEQLRPVVNQITSNLGNLDVVLQQGLLNSVPDIADTIHCTLALNSFHRLSGRAYTVLMDHIPPILPGLGNPELEIHFATELLKSYKEHSILDLEQLLGRATSLCEHVNNPHLECESLLSLFYVNPFVSYNHLLF